MAHAESYRPFVTARAGGACEFCRLLQAATGVTFHLEHIFPRSAGGPTTFANLALSCPGCNLAKSDRTTGKDRSGQIQPLFNLRAFESWLLGWHIHFVLDRVTGLVVPRTLTGEATVLTLDMNSPQRLFARNLQIQIGLIS